MTPTVMAAAGVAALTAPGDKISTVARTNKARRAATVNEPRRRECLPLRVAFGGQLARLLGIVISSNLGNY